jgi:hypothetical protein
MPTSFDLAPLPPDQASDEFDFYTDSGADVQFMPQDDGEIALHVVYPDVTVPGPVPAPAPVPPQSPPTQAGYVVCIDRIRCEIRAGAPSPRTVGMYQAYLNGQPIAGVSGFCVERQGPGDNTPAGVSNHRRIEAGVYPLFTHASATNRYKTIGYSNPGTISDRPWPCIGVENTGSRDGILIHCAAGFYMSIGCINLTDQVASAATNLDFTVSRSRVIQLINDMAQKTSNFPKANNQEITGATLVIRGEPTLQVADQVNANSGNQGLHVAAPIDDNLRNAITKALRINEIGDDSPYQISFAKKGNSGASFGFMQGDLAAKQPIVQQTFHDVLAAAGASSDVIAGLIARLSVHLIANPLTAQETDMVNKALLAGKNLVDAMDQNILSGVFGGLQQCIDSAAKANKHIDPKALIYMALWINMSGAPTSLLAWLSGQDPGLGAPVQPAGAAVDAAAMESYLGATHYFVENPGNLPHLEASAAAGATMLA